MEAELPIVGITMGDPAGNGPEITVKALSDPALYEELINNDDGVQFSHTMEEQVGGQLKAGFVLTHLFEDYNGEGRLHEFHVPTFVATRAIKPKE